MSKVATQPGDSEKNTKEDGGDTVNSSGKEGCDPINNKGCKGETNTKTEGENLKLTLESKMAEPEKRDKWPGYGRAIPVPYLEDYKEFDTWVKCVELWSRTSSIPKAEQGFHLLSEIPVKSEKYGESLREDILKAVDPDELVSDEKGVEKVITFLKSRFWVDKEEEIYTTHSKLKYLQRKKGQSISDYIIEYDKTLTKARQLKILPEEGDKRLDMLFALELMITSDLTSYEFMLIRSVAKITTEDGKRYDTVKSKMREILGKLNEKVKENNEIMLAQKKSGKEDDIQNSQMDEAYLAKGWKPPNRKMQYQNKNNRYQNHNNTKKQSSGSSNAKDYNKRAYRTKPLNPPGPDGKPMKCLGCKAETHLIRECPDVKHLKENKKYQMVYMTNPETQENEKVLIETSESEQDEQDDEQGVFCAVLCAGEKEDLNRFTAEALNMGALDTCCSASVAGEKWIKVYLKSLPKEMRDKVVGPLKSDRKFLFGNQGKLDAKAKYIIPTMIGGEYNKLEIDIIASDIPLLLSKNAMKMLGIALDMKNDKGTINGKPLILHTTSAGHYVVDLLNNKEEMNEVCIAELESNNDKEQIKALLKIHKQFGHRPKKQFVTILKEAGQWHEKFSAIIDDIMDSCEGCIMRKRTPDRPAVAPPLSNDFNQVLCLDLKVWDKNKGIYILYMIDHFTRYQMAAVVKSKEPEEIVKAITLKWLPVFGRMDKILSDNGGEFCNDSMREVGSLLNVQLLTTGANSPWQNGTMEKNHHTSDTIVRTTKQDFPNMSLEVALAWAITAVNSMSSVRGFSPHQLVFGRQIKLPNILEDPPPAWEEPEKSKSLMDTLNAIHKTRVEYTKAERCERIKRALRAKIRSSDTIYERGDIVYFKKEGEDIWRGPAKVIFQDNKIIFIRVGSVYYRVSANRLIKAGEGLAAKVIEKETHEQQEQADHTEDNIPNIKTRRPNRAEPIADTPDMTELRIEEKDRDNTEDDPSEVVRDDEIIPMEQSETTQPQENARQENEENALPNQNNTKQKGHKRRKVNQKPTPELNEDGTLRNAARVLKRNDRIEIFEEGKWEKGVILGHGGKVTGKHSGWFNFQLDNGQVFHDEVSNREIRYEAEGDDQESENEEVLFTIKLDSGKTMNVKDIDKRKIWIEKDEETISLLLLTEETLAVMLPRDKRDSPEAMMAKIEELNKLQAFNTYEEVDDVGQERITTTWVLTEKGTDVRARLTARGFQEDGEFPTDSPTVQKHSIKILLAIAATEGWDIQTTDITSAFLQGDKMDRKVFVQPPKEAQVVKKLWLLVKCLYGLKDASRKWYLRVLKKLKELGFKTSHYDSGLFFLIKDGVLIGIIALHVDDFLHAGNEFFTKQIMPQVLACFKVGKSETRDFLYTGFHMKQSEDGITIDQDKYIKNVVIPVIDLQQLKDRKRDMNQEELSLLRQLTGIVNWAARATRPELCFEMIDLSTKFKGGKVEDLIRAKNVANRLKKTQVTIKVANLDRLQDCKIVVYTDAAYRNLNNNTDSCGGFIVFLVNTKNGKCAPLEWKSGKLKRKVHSTLGAETQALNNGLDAALGAKLLIKELFDGKLDLQVLAITDNMSARTSIYSESEVGERILRGDIAIIKEMINEGRVQEVKWVDGNLMLADLLTKRGVNKLALLDVLQSGNLGKENLQVVNS